MTELLAGLADGWAATSHLEMISVAFGVAYIVLAARENSWCWPAAFIGTGTAVFLFWDASLLMESALNIYYLGMAVYGWWQWQKGGLQGTRLEVSTWKARDHVAALGLITILSTTSGILLANNTNAALPYLDSFTTWSAVLTTWMVARKILENWLYWIVINSASIYLYMERGLQLYALLFIVYIVIAFFGYLSWKKSMLESSLNKLKYATP